MAGAANEEEEDDSDFVDDLEQQDEEIEEEGEGEQVEGWDDDENVMKRVRRPHALSNDEEESDDQEKADEVPASLDASQADSTVNRRRKNNIRHNELDSQASS